MKIITSIAEMQSEADTLRRTGKRIGFVPTMGYLHEGHLSLIRKARVENEIVVTSIFVNPTQFGQNEDLDRYPRDPEGDRKKCESAGVDILFMPAAAEMYPEKPDVFVTVEGITDILEGAIRPGHFRGVATVVAKLFNIAKPHNAYFGQKDFQQCAVIKRLAAGLNIDMDLKILPTIREKDGLAMSSRNSYLSAEDRKTATVLYRALTAAHDLYTAGAYDPDKLRNKMHAVIQAEPGAALDYAEVLNPETFKPVRDMKGSMVLLLAVRIGRTRLIDNMVLP